MSATPLALTEAEWQALVVQYARLHGWQVFHHLDSRGTEPGWPDLVLIRPPDLVVAELKSERGKLTPSQEKTIAALTECGIEAHVWRPRHEAEVFARLGPTRKAKPDAE